MSFVARECPDVYRKTRHFVTIVEYLIHLMTGNYVTDWTYASRSNLFDLRTFCWSPELLSLFGVEEDRLSLLLAPGEICGTITGDFAACSGLSAGIPVICAGGDQQCAAVGQGVYKEGSLSVVAGTGAYLITTCGQVPGELPRGMVVNCASVKGKYILEANVLTCASAFDWFLRTFYDWQEPDYERIGEKLSRLSGKRSSCLVVPYFQGRSTPSWNPSARAAFHNLTLGTGREELLKALLEGIFMEIGNNIEAFRKYTAVESASISGGLTRSPVINQIMADVLGMPLTHFEDPEATGNGAWMAAMHRMTGLAYDDLHDRLLLHSTMTSFLPEAKLHAEYLQQREEMNGLYEKTCDIPGI